MTPKSKIIPLCIILLTISPIITTLHINATPERKWTFMVYLDADNNLESAGIKDLNEMEKVGSSANLAIIVQIDRIPDYDSTNGNWTETRRYYVTADNNTEIINSQALEDLGEQNMGESDTLSSFVNWTIQEYPAQHYALILWDHGGSDFAGPGVCWDDSNGKDYLYMEEIEEALADVYSETSIKIDVLAFDACLMGMIEVAYQLRNYVNYAVCSEETEPNDGYPYDLILAELSANPSMPPTQLATTIVTNYVNSYSDSLPIPEDAQHVTLAAYNLSNMSTTAIAVSELAEALIGDFNNSKIAVKSAWEKAETFHGDYVDLYNFTQLLKDNVENVTIKAKAQSVLDAVNSLVISEGHGTVHANAHGISIYYPYKYDKQSYIGLEFANDTFWDEFLNLAINVEVEITPVCPSYTSDDNIMFMDVAVGDVDGDLENEIVAVGNYTDAEDNAYFVIAVFKVTETGLIQLCNYTYDAGDFEELLSVKVADVDNDIIEEIVTCGGYFELEESVWYSYIGIFTMEEGNLVLQAYDEAPDISLESLDIADVDGDNSLEIVISGHIWYEYSYYAYVAVGNNSAVNSIDLECSYYWDIGYDGDLCAVAVGDTDADGIAEIIVGGEYFDYSTYAWTAYIAVLNCSQNLLYLQAYIPGPNLWVSSVDVVDVDGNGLNEIVISGYCWDFYGNIYMFIAIVINYPSNVIVQLEFSYWIVSGSSYIYSIDVADVEGDGMAEIVAVGYYYDLQSSTWKNYKAVLSWSIETGLYIEDIEEGESQTYSYSVTSGNVDDDSQTEIVTCSEEEGHSFKSKIEIFAASNPVVTTGTIEGTVTGQEGPIQNAIVEVSIPRLSIIAVAYTSADGSYTIDNLPEGCYSVKVYAEGKINETRNSVVVKAGEATHLDFTLVVIPEFSSNPLLIFFCMLFGFASIFNKEKGNQVLIAIQLIFQPQCKYCLNILSILSGLSAKFLHKSLSLYALRVSILLSINLLGKTSFAS